VTSGRATADRGRERHDGAVTITNADIVLRSLDGIELSATVLSPERPEAAVVLVHGGGVTWTALPLLYGRSAVANCAASYSHHPRTSTTGYPRATQNPALT
jgi:hypothetical protein